MKSLFTRLPEEIYRILQSYLITDDYLCLVNSSKREFFEIKRKTIYLKLSRKYSMMFLTNEKNFQQQINRFVTNPSQQICISMNSAKELFALQDVKVHRVVCHSRDIVFPQTSLSFFQSVEELDLTVFFSNCNDISYLSHMKSVRLSSFLCLTDVSPLRDVPVIALDGCHQLTNFNILGKQRTLKVTNCSSLKDLSSFSNIIELSIISCPLVQDISPLNNIFPILLISLCPLIKDLFPLLGSHKSLSIGFCSYELEGYEILRNIPVVHLNKCNIRDVGVLKEAKSVRLYNCNDLVDVSALLEVKKIDLFLCEKITDISSLIHVPELILSNMPGITNANLLRNRELTVNESGMHSCNLLTAFHARHLFISSFAYLRFLSISSFINLQYLSIAFAVNNFSTEGFADIPIVHIKGCENLQDISGLGRNREVLLSDCSLIRNVSNLRNVPIVTIFKCRGIEDYSCLSKVPRLKIVHLYS